MGWKTLKTRFNIVHIVQVTPEGICIGSQLIHDIMVVSTQGELTKGVDRWTTDENLLRYQAAFAADPQALRDAVLAQDTFERDIPVYTFDGAQIIEEQCEELGWPKVTHAGNLMYENRYFADQHLAIEKAISEARAGLSLAIREVERVGEELKARIADRDRFDKELAALLAAYPKAVKSA